MATKKSPKAKTTPKKTNGKAPATIAPTANTTITFKAQREKTGPKTDLLKLVPRKGSITVKELQAKAESEGLNASRVPKFVKSLAHYGYVELKGV
jgi:hypothetical protein